MHDAVERERRARRIAGGMNTGSEDSDWEEEFVGEMNTFQDLELGSMTPVVRREGNSPRHPPIQLTLGRTWTDFSRSDVGPTSSHPRKLTRQQSRIISFTSLHTVGAHHPRTLSIVPPHNLCLWGLSSHHQRTVSGSLSVSLERYPLENGPASRVLFHGA